MDDCQPTTVNDFLSELETWINTDKLKELAIKSNKGEDDEWTNKEFRMILRGWTEGNYDEDIPYLYNELENLLS